MSDGLAIPERAAFEFSTPTTTLGELAEFIDGVGAWHDDIPLAAHVRFEASRLGAVAERLRA